MAAQNSAFGGEGVRPKAAKAGSPRWFVVETQPRKEAYAQANLERQAFRSFCPRYSRTRRHARKVDTVLSPLFPNYLFVELDRTRDSWHAINGTFGVRGLVGNRGGEPTAMPAAVMAAILDRCMGEQVRQLHPDLRAGQQIRVTSGPFAERLAEVETLDEKGRVRVLLEILGGRSSLVLEPHQVDLA
jgi:transcriptional antiterminator RfaH